jgi:NitT/TauT family transport system substrate-binding protein
VELRIGLGYVPDVQFAQFYLADRAGYYRDAGLEVTFENKLDPELITLVGQGAIDIGIADGTSVIPAVSQGIPVRYVFTVYADFPSIVFAKASSGIRTPADLAGKKIGIPGRFGSSWIQLQALLAGVGLTPNDVKIVPFPYYGQLAALEQGVVDAATGFVNNEPVQLELAGTPTVVLALPAAAQLPGNGLIAGQAALDGPKADAIRAFIAATRTAMDEITADPQKGLEAAIARVPDLGIDRPAQLAVLEATIATWQNDYTAANGTGAVDAAAWERSIAFMSSLPDSPVAKPVAVGDCIDATFAAQ